MVRRDVDALRDVEDAFACCAFPVGESPTPVGVGAPGSRVAVRGEILVAEADRRKPLRGKQPRGPQHQVKPAASSEKQSGSRVAHLATKTTSDGFVPKRSLGPCGVEGAARVEGEVRNTRDPSSRLSSRRAVCISHRVKAHRVKRESEGIVVVRIRAQQNAREAKGPYFGHVGRGATCEGMAGR